MTDRIDSPPPPRTSLANPVTESRRGARFFLFVLWSLVDALRPPWMRFCGLGVSGIWLVCCVQQSDLIGAGDCAMGGMSSLFTDTSWGAVSAAMLLLCAFSIYRLDDLAIRKLCLIGLIVYNALVAFLILVVARPDRPIGWLHLMFAVLAFIAFIRPLLVEVFVRLYAATEHSEHTL